MYIFKAYNAAAISKVLMWKQDSSGIQFPPMEFLLPAAPQPVGHASEKIASFGDSVNIVDQGK